MTDIIASAQELAGNGHTPGPWETSMGEATPGRYVLYLDVDMEDPDNVELAAFAPEAVQALAEETWEYAAAWDEEKGMHVSIWYSKREYAEYDMDQAGERGAPSPRIVRRRVSSPEVVG